MEENSRLAQAAVIGTTFCHLSQFSRHIIDNADVARIWREGCGAQELSEDDRTRFDQLAHVFVLGLNSVFGQAEAARNEDYATAMPSIFARRVQLEPGLRIFWEAFRKERKTDGNSSFVEAVDIALDTLATQQEKLER
jgi:hypothetical protein